MKTAKDNSEIKAVILAAGLGTRLRPLTDTISKQMIPIAPGKPLLEHTIELLREQGFKDLIINVHWLPKIITDYFGDGSAFGVHIAYSDESDQLLETAGAIKKMEDMLSDPFILLYGDQLHFIDFRPMLEEHRNHSALATIALKRSDLPQNGDLAEIDPETKKIVKWHQRPHNITEFGDRMYLNTGLDVLSKRILDHVPAGRPVKLDIEIIPPLVEAGEPIYGYVLEDEVLDVGTMEKYEIAKAWYKEKISTSQKSEAPNDAIGSGGQ